MKTKNIVEEVIAGGGHVVILGAGASIASNLLNPNINGKRLPSMDNFIEVVGLKDIVDSLPEHLQDTHFENLYSKLHADNPASLEIKEIEKRVREYFQDMKLPEEPTIYDLLIMSLRSKDLIATFNWDPFLYQAWLRNADHGENPYIVFLHGNTAIGYSAADKRFGPVNGRNKNTYSFYPPTNLLFPITKKDYNSDEFTKLQWDILKEFLGSDTTKRITVFGYGAPTSDVEAVELLNESWGTPDERNMEQVEIIDIRPEDEIRKLWDNFIHSHHYDYGTSFFDSVLAHFPRRSSESWFFHYLTFSPEEAFVKSLPIPKDFKTLQQMWDWFQPLIDAEEKAKAKEVEEGDKEESD